MASFKFEMSKDWEKAMLKLDTLYDDVSEEMLNAGGKIVAAKLKAANATFKKFVKLKKPKKNEYGWFTYVTFAGKTSDGHRANTAAFVYEYGRDGKNPQPERPFIRATVKAAEGETVKAMENVLEEALKKL